MLRFFTCIDIRIRLSEYGLFGPRLSRRSACQWSEHWPPRTSMVKCKFVGTRSGCRLGAACTYEHSAAPSHPFTVHPDDHCETPAAAYDDILPVLQWLATALNKPALQLRIYDPYFCAGSVVQKLTALSFPNVYNVNEDFYQVQSGGRCPDFDVLLTNPPTQTTTSRNACAFAASASVPGCFSSPTTSM